MQAGPEHQGKFKITTFLRGLHLCIPTQPDEKIRTCLCHSKVFIAKDQSHSLVNNDPSSRDLSLNCWRISVEHIFEAASIGDSWSVPDLWSEEARIESPGSKKMLWEIIFSK